MQLTFKRESIERDKLVRDKYSDIVREGDRVLITLKHDGKTVTTLFEVLAFDKAIPKDRNFKGVDLNRIDPQSIVKLE